MLGRIARRRLAVFAVTVPLALLLGLIRESTDDRLVWNLVTALPLLLGMVLVIASLTAGSRHRPSALVAHPSVPELATPPNVVLTLVAAGQTFLLTGYVTKFLLDPARDATMLILAVLGIAAGALVWTAVLGPYGLRLRPTGIVDRQLFGTVVIPWDALSRDRPVDPFSTQTVTVTVTHPHTVTRTGLRRPRPVPLTSTQASGLRLPSVGVEPERVARAITRYTTHPDLRPLIGSEPEPAHLHSDDGPRRGPR